MSPPNSIFPGTGAPLSRRQLLARLATVGLTAAVSTALTRDGISCNISAGYHHDHLFVPVDRARDTMAVLAALSHTRA